MIDVDGVSLSFGDTAVLDGVDLTVDDGEFVGLVGPNGAGKTTLLRTVNGLLVPDAGTVTVDGDDVADLDARAVGRRVATVPQETHLEFAFTVEQVVEMGRTPHRSRLDWTEETGAVERALDRTETAHLADRPADAVSGGERQRVLLARALAQETPVLVLDEPTASLDVNHQVRVLELVRDLVADGRTALAAIHDLDLAARYCDRLAVLSDGRILAAGPPAAVLTNRTVERAFGTEAAVSEAPLTATPRVTAVGRRPERDARVHVLGGGRTGARAVGACWRAGYPVSAGPVPRGDAAATLAGDLGRPVVTAPPFDPLGEDALASLEAHLREADVVVRATADSSPAVDALVPAATPVVAWSDVVDDPGTLEGQPVGTDAGTDTETDAGTNTETDAEDDAETDAKTDAGAGDDGSDPTIPDEPVVDAVRQAVAGATGDD